jgi:hypothetical protein
LGLADGEYVEPAPDREHRVVLARRATKASPALWVGHTGDDQERDVAWYVDAVVEFIRKAADHPAEESRVRPLDDRRPLLGIPLVGTGAGGIRSRKGELVKRMVRALVGVLREVDADLVVVARDAAAYSALQQARSREWGAAWDSIRDQTVVMDLARSARRRRLVLFMGAGTGIGAGLPSWSDLLDRLAERAELNEQERSQLLHLDPRDAGGVLGIRMQQRGRCLSNEITRLVTGTHVSLVHQLLASMPVHEAVTTNYDDLFEQAWRDADRTFAVMPQQPAADSAAWLLKMHGSVDDPEQIVLSRDDYLRFEDERVALAGIVQTMLLTRHILFVGYSLSDDNFHRLVHQVRGIVGTRRAGDRRPFATALSPTPAHPIQELWNGDVAFVNTATGPKSGVRELAILLDAVGSEASAPAAHVEDTTYDDVFTAPEREVREAIARLRHAVRAEKVRRPVREAIEEALDSLTGARPE